MKTTSKMGVMGLVFALAASGYGHEVAAQAGLAVGGSRSNYGTRSLAPGFVPDPVRVAVTAGGPIDAGGMGLGAGCVGHVTRQPDFILRMSGNSQALKLRVEGGGDTSLIVNAADGQWVCNDDTNGLQPQVNLAGHGAGQYDVWVGRVSGDGPSTLLITEL